jgi:hypothetical protein
MGMYKEISHLEDQIFNTLDAAYKAFQYRQIDKYKLYLATLEMLNEDYKSITKVDFITQERIMNMYAKMWEI